MASHLVDVKDPSEDAIRWWNTISGSKAPDSPIPSRAIPASSFRPILTDLSPYFALSLAAEMSDDEFYTLVHRVVILIHPCDFVPLPDLLFPAFIDHLYNIRDSFTKRDVNILVTLLEWIPESATPLFLFYEFKKRVRDMTFVFDTFLELIRRKHSIWKSVISSNRGADVLFEKYTPILESDASDTIKMHVLDLLSTAFVEHSKLLSDQMMVSAVLWEKMVKLLHSENESLLMTALRSILFLWNGTRSIFAPIHHNRWLMEIINETVRPSIGHDLVMDFLLMVRPEGFNVAYLVKVLLLQGIEQPKDLVCLKRLCFFKHYDNQVVVIRYMLEMAGCNKHWAASCVDCLKELLPRFSEKPNVGSVVMSFTKQAFLFIGLCLDKSKYKKRVRILLDMFEAFYRLRLDYLNCLINRLYTTLVNTHRIEKDAAKLPVGREIETEFVEKLNMMKNEPIVLKRMLVHIKDENLTVASEVRRIKRGRASLNDLERGLVQSNVDFRQKPNSRISLRSPGTVKRLSCSSLAMVKRKEGGTKLPMLNRTCPL